MTSLKSLLDNENILHTPAKSLYIKNKYNNIYRLMVKAYLAVRLHIQTPNREVSESFYPEYFHGIVYQYKEPVQGGLLIVSLINSIFVFFFFIS